METQRHSVQALDRDFEQRVMNPEPGMPRQPIGKRRGGFAKNSEANENGDAYQQHMA